MQQAAVFTAENVASRRSPDLHGADPQFPLIITNLVVDHGSPVPLYEQICRGISSAVIAGDLPAGAALPTCDQFARLLGVGRNTVMSAYSRLAAEGYVTSTRRRGTQVAGNPAAGPAFRAPLPVTSPANGAPRPFEISFRGREWVDAACDRQARHPELRAPDPTLYPRVSLGRLIADEFNRPPLDRGEPLRRFQNAVASLLRQMRGVHCAPEQIVPVKGCEEALDLTTRVLIDPGHCVYVEDPADGGTRESLRAAGANVIPIPSDSQGADISRAKGPPPRLIVVSPSVTFPLGRQMGHTRRLALLAEARKYNSAIFECDRCWELAFTGARLPAIQANGGDISVLYYGSFYEALGPHIRAGYIVVPPTLAESFWKMAHCMAAGPDLFLLGAIARFVEGKLYLSHLKSLRSIYSDRLSQLSNACRLHLPMGSVSDPVGGLSMAVYLPAGVEEAAVCAYACGLNLPAAPLSSFYHPMGEPPQSGLVLGFGALPDRVIDSTVKRIGEFLRNSDHATPDATDGR